MSQSLLKFLEDREGFCAAPCNDPAEPHNATIGFGHELHSGPVTQADLERWGTISRFEGVQMLRSDLSKFEDEVNRDVRVPLTQNQFDALVSLTFNIGGTHLRHSTLLQLLNTGDYEGAAKHFTDLTRSGRAHPPGLPRRHEEERELFEQR